MRLARAVVPVLIVALLAGCGGGVSTPRPSVPLVTPAATVAPTPTTAVVSDPPATCSPGFVDATLDIPTVDAGTISIDLEPGGSLPSLPPEPASPDPDLPVDGTVLGGSELKATLVVDTGQPGDAPTITALAVEFVPDGTSVGIVVDSTFQGSTASLTAPDMEARGSLRATVAWTTTCDAGEAAGQVPIATLDSSVAAGCPTTGEGLAQLALDLDGSKVTYETLDLPIGITGWSARWMPGEAGGDFAQFSGWDRNSSVAATAGTSIVLRESIEDLALLSVRAAFYGREDVEEYLDPNSTIELNSVDVQRRSAGEKGRIGIPVPLDTGRYVMEVQGEVQTPCLNLQTYQVVSVDVVLLALP